MQYPGNVDSFQHIAWTLGLRPLNLAKPPVKRSHGICDSPNCRGSYDFLRETRKIRNNLTTPNEEDRPARDSSQNDPGTRPTAFS